MAYQVLARKWRPKQFEDVVGQTHVTRALQNSIKLKKLAHAYLFTGTRGVGKTSIARLFSKAIRCENPKPDFNPCLVCQNCKDVDAGNSLDYIEIDGASNNSVDDVRALIENVNYLPAKGQYKIYVVDEVHMLSVSAFNALLKTLEEPPAHVLFILATTDPHKLLGTVLSRCQRYDFKNVPVEILVNHINFIAREEGISFQSPWLIQKLAELGAGSVRDTLSLFDQVLGLSENNKVTDENFI
jgi:DNA polymerase-3 subunit gamma/tau